MDYNKVKELFNNEWIHKICNDLMNPTEFVLKNKKTNSGDFVGCYWQQR